MCIRDSGTFSLIPPSTKYVSLYSHGEKTPGYVQLALTAFPMFMSFTYIIWSEYLCLFSNDVKK